MIERAVVPCEGELIGPALLFGKASASTAARGDAVVLPLGTKLEKAERELILWTLDAMRNNKTRAAETLGVSPRTLHNKLRRYATEGAEST